MKFHEHQTLFQIARDLGLGQMPHNLKMEAWSDQELKRLPQDGMLRDDPAGWTVGHRITTEKRWVAAKRPYYSVYPFIADSLISLPLDIDAGLIRLPLKDLLVRFAVGHELDALGNGTRMVRSLIVSRANTTQGAGLVLMIDFGEHWPLNATGLKSAGARQQSGSGDTFILDAPITSATSAGDFPIQSYMSFALTPGTTVEQCLAQIDYREQRVEAQESEVALTTCVRLACTLCLLGDDPSIIMPDVLDKDRQRYEQTHDQGLVERAIDRGKRGWLIGAKLECDPHYRRPHFGLRWTGQGRTVPRIVPIKGVIVHRSKLSELPQGTLDDEASRNAQRLARQAAAMEAQLNGRMRGET